METQFIDIFNRTISADSTVRKNAEVQLQELERICPNYGTCLLVLIGRPDVDQCTKTSAAIQFKNFIKRSWRFDPQDESSDQTVDKISEEQRLQIKKEIIFIMLESEKHIQRQLSETITFIAKTDFPEKWSFLIEHLETHLKHNSKTDFNRLHGILYAAHSIFRRYRHELQSQKLWAEIKLVLEHFAQPLTDKFENLMLEASKIDANTQLLTPIYQSLMLCVKIYHSLIIQDLPDFFEDHLYNWIPNFLLLLETNVQLSEEGVIEDLKSEICEIASLFVQRYTDINNFSEFTQRFAESLWKLLTSTSQTVQYDILVSNAIRYLVTVADRSETVAMFRDPTVLNLLCQKIIIPNMELRDTDIELFEDNPDEYVRKDIDGSSIDTRRGAACSLVQALSKHMENELVSIFSGYMNEMQRSYMENRSKNWKHKDLAIFLFSSMATKQSTREHGAVTVSKFVNIEDTLNSIIIEEITREDDFIGSAILKCDALRFVTIFRYHIPRNLLVPLLTHIIRLITANDVVVRTYAAILLEKILTLRESIQTKVTAFKQNEFDPHLADLSNTLFKALEMRGSFENEYIMKAIMRLFSFVTSQTLIKYLPIVVPRITQKLTLVARNPSQPNFNHYLFESLAIAVRAACFEKGAYITEFETVLFSILEGVINQDIEEFIPYVLQLLNIILSSQQVESLTPRFLKLFDEIMAPTFWQKSAYVSPMANLLHTYIEKMPVLIVSQNKLLPVLGIFQKLIASKATDHEGLGLLKTLIVYIPPNALDGHMEQIFCLLFQRLSSSKTVKFVRNVLPCFALYAFKRGPEALAITVNKIQDRIFGMLLEKIFLLEAKKVTDPLDRKICICGMTKIVERLSTIDHGAYGHLTQQLLQLIVDLVELPIEFVEDDEDHFIEVDEIASSFEAQFSKLIFAGKRKVDYLSEITDVKSFVTASIRK